MSFGGLSEAQLDEIQGRRPRRAGEEFLRRGQRALSPPAKGSGGALLSPQQGSGQRPDCKYTLDLLRA